MRTTLILHRCTAQCCPPIHWSQPIGCGADPCSAALMGTSFLVVERIRLRLIGPFFTPLNLNQKALSLVWVVKEYWTLSFSVNEDSMRKSSVCCICLTKLSNYLLVWCRALIKLFISPDIMLIFSCCTPFLRSSQAATAHQWLLSAAAFRSFPAAAWPSVGWSLVGGWDGSSFMTETKYLDQRYVSSYVSYISMFCAFFSPRPNRRCTRTCRYWHTQYASFADQAGTCQAQPTHPRGVQCCPGGAREHPQQHTSKLLQRHHKFSQGKQETFTKIKKTLILTWVHCPSCTVFLLHTLHTSCDQSIFLFSVQLRDMLQWAVHCRRPEPRHAFWSHVPYGQ